MAKEKERIMTSHQADDYDAAQPDPRKPERPNNQTKGKMKTETRNETVKQRLEYLRGELRAERISYGELAELADLKAHIEPGDVELLEAAGVPEFPDENAPKHTPGDWQTVFRNGDFVMLGGNGQTVFMIGDTRRLIPSLEDRRVIEGAPGMLNALTVAQATIERLQRHAPGSANGTLDVIRAAIARATGGEI